MTDVLQALVGRRPAIEVFTGARSSARLIRLPDGLALVPLTESLAHQIGLEEHELPLLRGYGVPTTLANSVADASEVGAVSYLEAEFWGGAGLQASVIWKRAQVVFGPVIEVEQPPRPRGFRVRGRGVPPRPVAQTAINQALRYLGVAVRRGMLDEFDTVGLGRYRDTEEWR